MPDLIVGTAFEKALRSLDGRVSNRQLRRVLFRYCSRYLDLYWFEQLEDALAFLELSFSEKSADLESLLPDVRDDVERAMGEYCESLNEIATAVNRLLDERDLTVDDTVVAVSHVWKAFACNEFASDFVPREDEYLCNLVSEETKSA